MEYLVILVGIAAVVAVAVAAKAFWGAEASKGAKIAVATLFLCFATAAAAAVFIYLGPGIFAQPVESQTATPSSSAAPAADEPQEPATIAERISAVKADIKAAEKAHGAGSEEVKQLKLKLCDLEIVQKYGDKRSYGPKPNPNAAPSYGGGSSGGSGNSGGATAAQPAQQQELLQGQVLVTRYGTKYHLRKCGSGTYYAATMDEALDRGLTPCSKCF